MAKNSLLEISKILEDYEDDIKTTLEESCKEVAKEGAKKLRLTKNTYTVRSGEYNKSWTYKVEKGFNYVNAKIYSEKHYRLTHLLENGHATRNGGRTKAFKHISPVNDYVIQKFQNDVESVIGGTKWVKK